MVHIHDIRETGWVVYIKQKLADMKLFTLLDGPFSKSSCLCCCYCCYAKTAKRLKIEQRTIKLDCVVCMCIVWKWCENGTAKIDEAMINILNCVKLFWSSQASEMPKCTVFLSYVSTCSFAESTFAWCLIVSSPRLHCMCLISILYDCRLHRDTKKAKKNLCLSLSFCAESDELFFQRRCRTSVIHHMSRNALHFFLLLSRSTHCFIFVCSIFGLNT